VTAAFAKFFRDLRTVFSPRNLLWHALAIALTYVLVMSGADWWIVSTFRGSALQRFGFIAGLVGFLAPVVVPLCLLLVGWLRKQKSLIKTGWLIAQAEITALLVSFFYKAFTGRPGPIDLGLATTATDTSHMFRFGFLQGGVFWGWPSSHIIVAVAGAVLVMKLYKHQAFIKYLALAYAAYMALFVSISFHWFSDAVAAVILGIVVGLAVARGERA